MYNYWYYVIFVRSRSFNSLLLPLVKTLITQGSCNYPNTFYISQSVSLHTFQHSQFYSIQSFSLLVKWLLHETTTTPPPPTCLCSWYKLLENVMLQVTFWIHMLSCFWVIKYFGAWYTCILIAFPTYRIAGLFRGGKLSWFGRQQMLRG